MYRLAGLHGRLELELEVRDGSLQACTLGFNAAQFAFQLVAFTYRCAMGLRMESRLKISLQVRYPSIERAALMIGSLELQPQLIALSNRSAILLRSLRCQEILFKLTDASLKGALLCLQIVKGRFQYQNLIFERLSCFQVL